MGNKNIKDDATDNPEPGGDKPILEKGSESKYSEIDNLIQRLHSRSALEAPSPPSEVATYDASILLTTLQPFCNKMIALLETNWNACVSAKSKSELSERRRVLEENEDRFKSEFLSEIEQLIRYHKQTASFFYDGSHKSSSLDRLWLIDRVSTEVKNATSAKEVFDSIQLGVFGCASEFYRGEVELDIPRNPDITVGKNSLPMPDIPPSSELEVPSPETKPSRTADALSQLKQTAKSRVGEIVSFRDEDGIVYEMRAVPEEEAREEEREAASKAMAKAGVHPQDAYYKSRGEGETLEEFVIRAYGKFCTPGNFGRGDSPFPLRNIYQDQLGAIDPSLLSAIKRLAATEGNEVPRYVLPKSARISREIDRSRVAKRTAAQIVKRAYAPLKRKK